MKLTQLYNILSLAKPLAEDIISGPIRFNQNLSQALAARTHRVPTESPSRPSIYSKIVGTVYQAVGLGLSAHLGVLTLALMTPGAPPAAAVIGLAGIFGVAAFSPLTTKAMINLIKYADTTTSALMGEEITSTKEQASWPQVEGFPAFNKAKRELNL